MACDYWDQSDKKEAKTETCFGRQECDFFKTIEASTFPLSSQAMQLLFLFFFSRALQSTCFSEHDMVIACTYHFDNNLISVTVWHHPRQGTTPSHPKAARVVDKDQVTPPSLDPLRRKANAWKKVELELGEQTSSSCPGKGSRKKHRKRVGDVPAPEPTIALPLAMVLRSRDRTSLRVVGRGMVKY